MRSTPTSPELQRILNDPELSAKKKNYLAYLEYARIAGLPEPEVRRSVGRPWHDHLAPKQWLERAAPLPVVFEKAQMLEP